MAIGSSGDGVVSMLVREPRGHNSLHYQSEVAPHPNAATQDLEYFVDLRRPAAVPVLQNGITDHDPMQTWKVTYYVEGVRDWLFAQRN